MKQMIRGLAFATFSFFALTAFGDKHSKVETKAVPGAEGVELNFLVKPDSGFHLTTDAPWQLTLNNVKGLKLETKDGKFSTNTFDEKLPGFKIKAPVEAGINSGSIDYTVKAFICTDDKKQCYPQFHKGTIDWKRS